LVKCIDRHVGSPNHPSEPSLAGDPDAGEPPHDDTNDGSAGKTARFDNKKKAACEGRL
jgi:hypothetical protein